MKVVPVAYWDGFFVLEMTREDQHRKLGILIYVNIDIIRFWAFYRAFRYISD